MHSTLWRKTRDQILLAPSPNQPPTHPQVKHISGNIHQPILQVTPHRQRLMSSTGTWRPCTQQHTQRQTVGEGAPGGGTRVQCATWSISCRRYSLPCLRTRAQRSASRLLTRYRAWLLNREFSLHTFISSSSH